MKDDHAFFGVLREHFPSQPLEHVSTFAQFHARIDEIGTIMTELLQGGVYIHPSASVHATAVLEESIYLGPGVEVGPFTYLRRCVALFEDVRLGFNVELDHCVIAKGSRVAHSACIGRSFVGEASNLGYGFVTATRRLDDAPVRVRDDNGVLLFESSESHHGAVIGAGVHSAVYVSTMPGASIPDQSPIPPRTDVKGLWRG